MLKKIADYLEIQTKVEVINGMTKSIISPGECQGIEMGRYLLETSKVLTALGVRGDK